MQFSFVQWIGMTVSMLEICGLTKELRGDVDPKFMAMLVVSALEGASLIAWALNDTSVFKPTIKQVVASLQP